MLRLGRSPRSAHPKQQAAPAARHGAPLVLLLSAAEPATQVPVLYVRFVPGADPFPDGRIPKGSAEQQAEALLQSLPDVELLMNTMPGAIRQIARASTPAPREA